MRMELYGCRLGEWYTYNVSIGTSSNEHDTYKQYWSITNYSFSLSRQDIVQSVECFTAERQVVGSIPGVRSILRVLK